MNNKILIILVILVIILLIIWWVFKNYFSLNKEQLTTGSQTEFMDVNNLNIHNDDTITDSNNELSTHAFDGVNQNPEHKDKAKLSENLKNSETSFDIANESSLNQGYALKEPKPK